MKEVRMQRLRCPKEHKVSLCDTLSIFSHATSATGTAKVGNNSYADVSNSGSVTGSCKTFETTLIRN